MIRKRGFGENELQSSSSANTILVIDDDVTVQRVLRRVFTRAGFGVTECMDCKNTVHLIHTIAPQVVILGVPMVGSCGPDLCQEIRSGSPLVPIIVLSADSDEMNKVLLLELGADDYVTKPFSSLELLARVRAAVRRFRQAAKSADIVSFDDIVVNFRTMELLRSGRSIGATRLEFGLLQYFVQNQDRVISNRELYDHVWKIHPPASRTITTHIFRLRQKLEKDPTRPTHLQTVHCLGHRFIA